jgi:hypothetical protein
MVAKQFLDEVGVRFLCTQLVNKMDIKIKSRITNVIDSDSTNEMAASAKAVYEFLIKSLENIGNFEFKTVLDLPTVGTPGTIYLTKEPSTDPNSRSYRRWIYIGGEWIDLGLTEANLSDVWYKSELVPITNQEIEDILDDVFGD